MAYRLIGTDYEYFSLIDRYQATLHFDGIYDPDSLAALYARLPEILEAAPSAVHGDGPTICLTKESNVWHYVFDQAGGDCPAGCTEHDYYYFSSDSDSEGAVEGLGTWHYEPGVTAPGWVQDYVSADACH